MIMVMIITPAIITYRSVDTLYRLTNRSTGNSCREPPTCIRGAHQNKARLDIIFALLYVPCAIGTRLGRLRIMWTRIAEHLGVIKGQASGDR